MSLRQGEFDALKGVVFYNGDMWGAGCQSRRRIPIYFSEVLEVFSVQVYICLIKYNLHKGNREMDKGIRLMWVQDSTNSCTNMD